MSRTKLITGVVFLLFLLCSTISYALMVGDAPNPYGVAKHQTTEWQMLGSSTADNGVWWSTDGTNWGHDAVYVGDQIQFKFALWSAGYGNHTYDQVKSWVDWNQDGIWNNDSSEVVLADRFWKVYTDDPSNPLNPGDNISFYDDTDPNFDHDSYNLNYATTTYFETAAYTIGADMVGSLWLRARAQCWHVPFDTMQPTGELWQGEVEDWMLTVNSTPVPEPATMILLGTGIIGIAASCRKKFKR